MPDLFGQALAVARLIEEDRGGSPTAREVASINGPLPGDHILIDEHILLDTEIYTGASSEPTSELTISTEPRTPGGRALRYEASTRIRFGPRTIQHQEPFHVRYEMPKSRLRDDQRMLANDAFGTCTLNSTHVDWGAVTAALRARLDELAEAERPKKSVWEWIRNPAL